LTASFLLTTASFTIKVVYDHTRIASYRRWGERSAGLLRLRLLALNGRSAKLAGGLSHRVEKGRAEIARISLPSQLELTPQLGW
jgi:hypothetical protein